MQEMMTHTIPTPQTFRFARLRTILAFVLLCALFLPFSSCTHYVDEVDGHSGTPSGATLPQTVMVERLDPTTGEPLRDPETGEVLLKEMYLMKTTHYILRDFDPRRWAAWGIVVAFLWPIPILLVAWRTHVASRGLRVAEFLCPLLACGMIGYGVMLQTPEIGAYSAFFTNCAYIVIWIFEAFMRRRARQRTPVS
jgi:hypothetical protein